MEEILMKDRVGQLIDYIMKWSLWQFNSRSWDREQQNEGILTRATQILCDEPAENGTPQSRYYWSEAVVMAKEFKKEFSWFCSMGKDEIKLIMKELKEQIDYLTITGSKNEEIKNPQ